jgi:hypothetical protein
MSFVNVNGNAGSVSDKSTTVSTIANALQIASGVMLELQGVDVQCTIGGSAMTRTNLADLGATIIQAELNAKLGN